MEKKHYGIYNYYKEEQLWKLILSFVELLGILPKKSATASEFKKTEKHIFPFYLHNNGKDCFWIVGTHFNKKQLKLWRNLWSVWLLVAIEGKSLSSNFNSCCCCHTKAVYLDMCVRGQQKLFLGCVYEMAFQNFPIVLNE